MKEKTLYTCEKCHTDYANKKDAETCEANHSKKLKIITQHCLPYSLDKSGFPIMIEVQDDKGNKAIYKR